MRALLNAALLASAALLLFLASGSNGRAATITRCGESQGYGWYFAGPVVPSNKAGWQKDGITGGDLTLIFDGDQPDIVYTDAAGTRSARASGATALSINGAAGYRLIVVLYPAGAIEHYLFNLDAKGNGTVVWGTARSAGPIQKSSLFVAKCRAP